MMLNIVRLNYPICVLVASANSKLQSTLIHCWKFVSYRTFWDKCTHSWHQKMALNTIRSKVSYISVRYVYLLVQPTPSFQACHLRVTCHFETTAINGNKITLNVTGLKVPHICSVSTPQVTLQLFIFQIIEVFGFALWYNRWIWHLCKIKVKNVEIQIFRSQKCSFVKTMGKNQRKFGTIQKQFKWGVAFYEIFAP